MIEQELGSDSDRKASSVCEECDKALCKTHSLNACSNCFTKSEW